MMGVADVSLDVASHLQRTVLFLFAMSHFPPELLRQG